MSIQNQPSVLPFTGIIYNSQFYQESTGISQTFADQRYLQRTGTPISISTLTSFSGLVSLSGGLNVSGGSIVDGLTLNGNLIVANTYVTPQQLSYISGLTSSVQNQINSLPQFNGNNNWTGNNTFNSYLPTSSLTPLSSQQLTTKLYVDNIITQSNIIARNNTWTGNNLFNSYLPTSTLTPSISTQLTTKSYVDSAIINANIISLNNFWTGNNIFNGNVSFGGTINGNTYQTQGDNIVNTNLSVAQNLIIGGNVTGQNANFGGALTAQSLLVNQFVYTSGLYVSYNNISVGGQLLGYTYNAGYLHISNVYNFTLIKSIPSMTGAFSSSYQPSGINLSTLLGVYGTGYILLQPLYSVAFMGTDGSVLCYIDNTYSSDQIFVLVSFPGTVTCLQLNIFYQYIQI